MSIFFEDVIYLSRIIVKSTQINTQINFSLFDGKTYHNCDRCKIVIAFILDLINKLF